MHENVRARSSVEKISKGIKRYLANSIIGKYIYTIYLLDLTIKRCKFLDYDSSFAVSGKIFPSYKYKPLESLESRTGFRTEPAHGWGNRMTHHKLS